MSAGKNGNDQGNMSLVGHLKEIRNRIAVSVLVLIVAFFACFAIIKPLANELLIVLAIVLVIFGPKALPKLGRSMGKTLGSFRKGLKEDAADDEEDA